MAAPRKELPAGVLLVAAIALLLLAGTAAWFMIPEPQSQHGFASPTGRAAIHVGEYCTEERCTRRIVAEFTTADGTRARRGCAIELPDTEPLFGDPRVVWSADEQSVELVHAGGTLALDLARDCTLTE